MGKLTIIAGPTASGKTSVAVALAQQINGEVVSADSMQIYRGMDIGTAKPTMEERQGIAHHIIDIVNPNEPFSAAEYQQQAVKIIDGIFKRGKTPIVAGGTGFYINALIYNNDFTQSPDDTANREKLMCMDATALHRLLQAVDPVSAAIIHPNNKKRTARALSFFQFTGQPLSEHNKAQKQNTLLYDTTFIILNASRSNLYERINQRTDAMIKNGFRQEVQGLLDKGYTPSLTAMQSIGYKEMVKHIQGEMGLTETIAAIQQSTRHYAKRQITWFRHQAKDARWVDTDGKSISGIITRVLD